LSLDAFEKPPQCRLVGVVAFGDAPLSRRRTPMVSCGSAGRDGFAASGIPAAWQKV
jgi:hypothetical protein